MKTKKNLILIVTGFALAITTGLILFSRQQEIPTKMLIIYALIIFFGIFGIFIAFKKIREEKEGQPAEDEYTMLVKYKAGFYAYIASMYMWFFLFLFRNAFPDTGTLLGGGILLSALIGYIAKLIVKREKT